jgi:hypothetical protein
MSTETQCPSCHKQNRNAAAFCQHCGQRIPKADGGRQAIVNRTAEFSDLQGAQKAVNDYLTRWPDGPEVRDISFTRNCIRLLLNLIDLGRGTLEVDYKDLSRLASDAAQGLPARLANGLATSARVQNQVKRDRVLAELKVYHDLVAVALGTLYQAAENESKSLLVGGKTQASIKRLTMEDVDRDAVPPSNLLTPRITRSGDDTNTLLLLFFRRRMYSRSIGTEERPMSQTFIVAASQAGK